MDLISRSLSVGARLFFWYEYSLQHNSKISSPMAEPPTLARQPSAVTALSEANHGVPPGRVRHMFKKLTPPLDLECLINGFRTEFDAPDFAAEGTSARTKLELAFSKASKDGGIVVSGTFSRFYCEALFRWVDADDNDMLELAEFEKALKHLVKPNAPMPAVAFPPQFTAEDGEVHLPMQWFWPMFSSME